MPFVDENPEVYICMNLLNWLVKLIYVHTFNQIWITNLTQVLQKYELSPMVANMKENRPTIIDC